MSRIGTQPIDIVEGVTVTVEGRTVTAKGKLGEQSLEMPELISAQVEDGKVVVTRENETREARSCHGLIRSLIANLIEGVSKGFSKILVIEGVGFRAAIQGQTVSLSLGFAGPKVYTAPDGITVTEEKGTRVTVTGINKQLVGNTAARIRSYYPAEPYKGKGVRYVDEKIRRKVGKTVA